MIATRIEKLRFIVEEMHIALHLATHAPDAFVARTLVRHVLIRAENFIEHARGLRKPLNVAQYDTREFHRTKEEYATNFEEYFGVARDRLGAHVQDFDFGKRIELWNEIEIVKIDYFVDGAREIYQTLAAMNIPAFVPYADPPELADPILTASLLDFQQPTNSGHWVEIGSDPLAMTRENTAAALNMTPVHARAGQLALIRRWMGMQRDLLDKLTAHSRVVRILKVRIVTDIVSFCDCLVTRPVSAGAPQEMDGLDKLIAAASQSAEPIDTFVAAANFQAELAAARAIRDQIGGHVEIDDARTLSSLIGQLDAYDLSEGLAFYRLVENVFLKTCKSVVYLRMYAADGQRMYGVTTGGGTSVPFSREAVTSRTGPPPPPPVNDEDAYRQYFTQWMDGDGQQREEARQFFYQAFSASEIVEQITETEWFGSSSRRETHDFRKAHRFMAAALTGSSDSGFFDALKLVVSCRNGWPYPLAELLVRHGRTTSDLRRWWDCYALGEIGSSPHASATEFLKACARSSTWTLRLQATLALFKTFVKAEGLYRLNYQGRTKNDYQSFVNVLTASMPPRELLLTTLAFASILSEPAIGSFSRPFASDYAAHQAQIQSLCAPYVENSADGTGLATLRQLIETNDYVGVCVHVAISLEPECNARKQLRELLLDECCNGAIATAGHDQAARHLAMCLLVKKEHARALEVAKAIAARNPEWIVAQVLVAQILAAMPATGDEATRQIANVRRSYQLDPDGEAALVAAEQLIAQRVPSRPD